MKLQTIRDIAQVDIGYLSIHNNCIKRDQVAKRVSINYLNLDQIISWISIQYIVANEHLHYIDM